MFPAARRNLVCPRQPGRTSKDELPRYAAGSERGKVQHGPDKAGGDPYRALRGMERGQFQFETSPARRDGSGLAVPK
jgi:hypothetical protein